MRLTTLRLGMGILAGFVCGCALIATVYLAGASASAKASTTLAQPTPPTEPSQVRTTRHYWLALPLPAPGLTYDELRASMDRVYRQWQPQLDFLSRSGLVLNYELVPVRNAVRLDVQPQTDLAAIGRQIQSLGPLALDGTPLAECVDARAQRYLDILKHTQVREQLASLGTPQSGRQPAVISPTIHILPHSPDSAVSADNVFGTAAPSATVQLRVLRNGAVVATEVTSSTQGGGYSIYATVQDCPVQHRLWALLPSDVVEVSAAGAAVTTTYVPITGWMRAPSDLAYGHTLPAASVQVQISSPGGDVCGSGGSSAAVTVTANNNGDFLYDFTSQLHFNSNAVGLFSALDANGNGTTYVAMGSYQISIGGIYGIFGPAAVGGWLEPNVSYTVVISRSGGGVFSSSGIANSDGSYVVFVNPEPQAGDTINLYAGGYSSRFTMAPLTAQLGDTNNLVTGLTAPGLKLRAHIDTIEAASTSYGCSGLPNGCMTGIADASGHYTITMPYVVPRGSYATVYTLVDREHSQTAVSDLTPMLFVDRGMGHFPTAGGTAVDGDSILITSGVIGGWWPSSIPGSRALSITGQLRTGQQGKLAMPVWLGTGSYWGLSDLFVTGLNSYVNASDFAAITVTNGTYTQSMHQPSMDVRLDTATDVLYGSAEPGYHLISRLVDLDRFRNYAVACQELTTSGTLMLSHSGAIPSAGDYSQVSVIGPDGYYTFGEYHSIDAAVNVTPKTMQGYVETAGVQVTATWWRGETLLDSFIGWSTLDDAFRGAFVLSPGLVFTMGDTITIETSDGQHADIPAPALTAAEDLTHNLVVGHSPPDDFVDVTHHQRYSAYYTNDLSERVNSDATGQFTLTLSGRYTTGGVQCLLAHAEPCAWADATYYTAHGFTFLLYGPEPPPRPDAYERDNTSAMASVYTQMQVHSFDAITDVDWIRFSLTPGDINSRATIRVRTFNLDVGGNTIVTVYGPDATTVLATDANVKPEGVAASSVTWKPGAPGTYYIQVAPADAVNAGYCNSSYQLTIERSWLVILPIVRR